MQFVMNAKHSIFKILFVLVAMLNYAHAEENAKKSHHYEERIIEELGMSNKIGLGVNVFAPSCGFVLLGLNDVYRKDLFETKGALPVNVEFYIQFPYLPIFAEILNTGVKGLWTYAFGFNWVAYVNHYIKVRGYLSFGGVVFPLKLKREALGLSDSDITIYDGGTFTAAADIEYKFGSASLFGSDKHRCYFSLVGKVGLTFIGLEYEKMGGFGVSPFVSLGIGSFFSFYD